GASVIRGNLNGVATRMIQINPYIFTTHCIAYKLALACEAAEKQVQTLSKYQEVLNMPILKIKKIFDICWLSFYEAINNFCLSIEPLLDTFLHTMIESKN
ncbi:5094_t:CDS:2, partial [Dentiscutata heterogama]